MPPGPVYCIRAPLYCSTTNGCFETNVNSNSNRCLPCYCYCTTAWLYIWTTKGGCTTHVQIKTATARGESLFLVSHLMHGAPNSSHHKGQPTKGPTPKKETSRCQPQLMQTLHRRPVVNNSRRHPKPKGDGRR